MTTKTMCLDIFQPDARNEQSRFFDDLEGLLASLHEHGMTPDKVHSVVHNTRTWMALVIVEAVG